MVEIACVHVRDVRARGLAPLGHAVGVLARKFFHGAWRAAVRVAFTQHGVDGRAGAFGVAGFQGLFFIGLGVLGVVRQGEAFGLQLFDGCHQLAHGSTDVGQLDDVRRRVECQLAQLNQVVGRTLLRRQHV